MNKKRVFFSVVLLLIVAMFNYFFFLKIPGSIYELINGFHESGLELRILVISFFIQWFLVILIFIIGVLRHLKNKKIQKMVSRTPLPEKKMSSKMINTEMDNFYKLLTIDKKMTITAIAAKFRIKKEIALEWAKILENQNLATIEYPAFGEPRVKEYRSEKDNEKNLEDNKEGEKSPGEKVEKDNEKRLEKNKKNEEDVDGKTEKKVSKFKNKRNSKITDGRKK